MVAAASAVIAHDGASRYSRAIAGSGGVLEARGSRNSYGEDVQMQGDSQRQARNIQGRQGKARKAEDSGRHTRISRLRTQVGFRRSSSEQLSTSWCMCVPRFEQVRSTPSMSSEMTLRWWVYGLTEAHASGRCSSAVSPGLRAVVFSIIKNTRHVWDKTRVARGFL